MLSITFNINNTLNPLSIINKEIGREREIHLVFDASESIRKLRSLLAYFKSNVQPYTSNIKSFLTFTSTYPHFNIQPANH